MTARQALNVTYAFMAEGRDADGLAELDAALEPPIEIAAQERRRAFVLMAGGEIGA